MPSITALRALHKALPEDLFDLLLPDGVHGVPDPAGIDYFEFAKGCRAYLLAMGEAQDPSSPGGCDVVDEERPALNMKVIPLRGKVA